MAEEDRARRGTNELVLPSGEFAYTRDTTSGVTYVRCGPAVVNAQAQDEPVVYDKTTGRFRVIALSEAAQVNTVVPTGHYAVLSNPAIDVAHPTSNKEVSKDLAIGQRVHIPGPVSFALWPRQHAQVIEGHQLRSNQYLLVRVYDEQAARENWKRAVVKKAAPSDATTAATTTGTPPEVTASLAEVPKDLSVGRLLVIRGTEVSFYIPPTGIEVLQSETGEYVREALTLERLQYCILIDEDGNKRYVRGPDVVFPLPTERFHKNTKEELRFRPIELNGPIQGVHIKVIAKYVDENGDHGPKGKEYKEGDELFITGETTPIYFPCEQHSAIKYDGNTKHFATAIPAGDARYVLHRHTGATRMAEGGEEGSICLPDPRFEVFVRRVLSDAECEIMYPGNEEVLAYNQQLREIQAKVPTTRKGMVSDGDAMRGGVRGLRGGGGKGLMAAMAMSVGDAEFANASLSNMHTSAEMGGDEFSRASSYTEPRMVTLGVDKFSGVPKINLWTGFAVLVVDTAGNRQVHIGPKRVLLGFNETLESLALSTGKPKNTDNLLKTAYLQIDHNKVTDIMQAVTSDHVNVSIKAAFRVNFEGDDPTKWFAVANYVKLLSDHVRSVLKAVIRRTPVEEFFQRSEDFIRDVILGKKPDDDPRPGMLFSENNMRIYDVEIFNVTIGDAQIQTLLDSAQHEAVKTSVELAQELRRLDALKQRENIAREASQVRAETSEFNAKLELVSIRRTLTVTMQRLEAEVTQLKNEQLKQTEAEAVKGLAWTSEIERQRERADNDLEINKAKEALRLEALNKETEARVQQLNAMREGFSEALLALSSQETIVKVAEAMSVQAFAGGKTLVDVIQKTFAGTPLEKIGELMQKRALASSNGTTGQAQA